MNKKKESIKIFNEKKETKRVVFREVNNNKDWLFLDGDDESHVLGSLPSNSHHVKGIIQPFATLHVLSTHAHRYTNIHALNIQKYLEGANFKHVHHITKANLLQFAI